jgi:hypothetical protein
VKSADLAAGLYLHTKPPPELGVISENRIDELDRDRAPGPRPAEENLAHPARPKTTNQNIVPDSPGVSWPKGIHAAPSRKGMNPPEPDDSRKWIAEKDFRQLRPDLAGGCVIAGSSLP